MCTKNIEIIENVKASPCGEARLLASRTLTLVRDDPSSSAEGAPRARAGNDESPRTGQDPRTGGPSSLDGVSGFMGLRWEDAQTVRMAIRPELINRGGLLSGVATYAMVDYCMGSTLWAQTTPDERIATINISINYIQTATAGEVVCRTVLDRRNRTVGIMKSEVRDEHERLLVTAVGIYSIRIPRELREPSAPSDANGAR